WEAAGRWDDAVVPEAVPEAEQSRPTIRSAVKAYLAEHEKNSARGTVKKYTMLMAKILAWSDHKGYVTLDQWGPQNVRECRDSWTVSPRTANRDMSIVRAFFEFCYSNEWIERNPGRLVKNPRGKAGADSRNEQKLPFTDEELALMYDVAEKRYGKLEIKWDRHIHHRSAIGVVNSYRYSWTGKDLAEFISVSVYTGLRISDVA